MKVEKKIVLRGIYFIPSLFYTKLINYIETMKQILQKLENNN